MKYQPFLPETLQADLQAQDAWQRPGVLSLNTGIFAQCVEKPPIVQIFQKQMVTCSLSDKFEQRGCIQLRRQKTKTEHSVWAAVRYGLPFVPNSAYPSRTTQTIKSRSSLFFSTESELFFRSQLSKQWHERVIHYNPEHRCQLAFCLRIRIVLA